MANFFAGSLETFGLPGGLLAFTLSSKYPMESSSSAYEIFKVIGGMLGCVLIILVPALFLFTLIMAMTRKSKGWIVATIIAGTVSLVMVGVVAVYGVRFGSKALKEQQAVQVFTTTDGLATVTGAPGWRVLDLESGDATLSIGSLAAEEYLLVISELKSDFEVDFTLSDFAEIASQQTIDTVKEPVSGELMEKTIQGLSAYEREVSGTIEGTDVSYVNHYVEGREHFYQVMAWTLTNRKERAFPRLRAAADSFTETAAP